MTNDPIRVLAVDDSRTVRRMIELTLERAGIHATVAEDGIDGLDRLGAMDAPPDVVITDINMPRLDGFGFIERVRGGDRHADVPILVLTTEDAPDLKRRARAAGAKGWIVKPFDPPRLVGALRAVAGR
ncbi:response regulator [Jannaschia sp. Os4]|uniref:response regulator n=1 Tax=Jannaschia sp. Os4 TaxID=2807617 RepID=UPI001939367E|nr:response regulator [Jannaschia sp. Os4]MBM2576485.1 response regulator [Jannaschia sp. Os4]